MVGQALLAQIIASVVATAITAGVLTKRRRVAYFVIFVGVVVIVLTWDRHSKTTEQERTTAVLQQPVPTGLPSHAREVTPSPAQPTPASTGAITPIQRPKGIPEREPAPTPASQWTSLHRFEDIQVEIPEGWRVSADTYYGWTPDRGTLTLVLANEMARPTSTSPRSAIIQLLTLRSLDKGEPFNESVVSRSEP